MINWKILLLIFFLFALADKTLTAINIHQVNKNFPEATKGDYYKVERNPIAKKLFEKFGLLNGSIAYLLIGIATMFVFFTLVSKTFNDSIALYSVFMIYGFVIFNNLYFLLKYSRIIP